MFLIYHKSLLIKLVTESTYTLFHRIVTVRCFPLVFNSYLKDYSASSDMSAREREIIVTVKNPRRRKVQFMKTPCSSANSLAPKSLLLSTPPDLDMTPTLLWRRASSAILADLEIDQQKVNKNKKWKRMTDKIEKRRQKMVQQQLENYREAHLPVLDKGAVKRSTYNITERKRVCSAVSDKSQEPCQPDDMRSRPSTELKNRIKEHRLPVSYNNFIVNQLEITFRGKGYETLRT